MLNRFFSILFLFAVLLTAQGCLKRETYPIEPHIEFVNFIKYQNEEGIDTKGTLIFSFTDGDGDIGLSAGDTLPPFHKEGDYHYNMYIFYKEMQNGVLTEVNLPLPFHLRLPVITPSGNNKAIKGDMEVELDIYNPISVYDTICFSFYLVDRALHVSNTITTPLIVINK